MHNTFEHRRGERTNSISSVNKYDTPDPSLDPSSLDPSLDDDVPLIGADSPLASPSAANKLVRYELWILYPTGIMFSILLYH